MKKVAIVGAGISGLLSAFFLAKKGYEITVFEKEAKAGGKLQTVVSPCGLMEKAANGILADSLVEEVCREIGVELIPTLKSSRARYIYSRGKPRRWPLGILSSLKLVRFLMKKPWRDENSLKDKDLKSWLNGHLPGDVVDKVFSPACQGIFGAGADQLSANLIMNYFFNKKKVPKGKLRGTVSASQGMSEIIQKLEIYLRSKGVRFESRDITTLEQLVAEYHDVVVATDMVAASRLLESIRDFRGSAFKSVPTVDLVSINGFFSETSSPYPGFGILFPRGEGIEAMGVLQNTYIFRERSKSGLSETWIYRTEGEISDNALLEKLKADRKTVLGYETIPLQLNINRWPKALPLYGKDLERSLSNMPPGHPRVHVIGNYLGEIGLNRLFRLAKELSL